MIKVCKNCERSFDAKGNKQYCDKCGQLHRKDYQHHYNVTHRKQNSQYMKQYYADADHYRKHLIRVAANNAGKAGKLAKGSRCSYPGCKCHTDLQKHHVDYDADFAPYLYLTLCRKHHAQLHREQRMKKLMKMRSNCITFKNTKNGK